MSFNYSLLPPSGNRDSSIRVVWLHEDVKDSVRIGVINCPKDDDVRAVRGREIAYFKNRFDAVNWLIITYKLHGPA